MESEKIQNLVKEKFGAAILEVRGDVPQPWAKIDPEKIVEVATFLRDHPETRFDFLRFVAGIDYPPELEVVYHLFSYPHRHEFVLKVRVPRERPVVPTVEGVWPAAGWHEREAYDLLGIEFRGHSDLRRLLLPDDWVGHPLRKDYKEQDSYHGVSTTREYLTGMPTLPTLPPVPAQGK